MVQIALLLVSCLCLTRRSWRPVGIALGLSTALDALVPLMRLAPRPDLALWLLTPVLSGWVAWRVLVPSSGATVRALWTWSLAGSAVLALPRPSLWWEPLPVVVRLVSIAVQLGAVAVWRRSRRVGSTVDAAVLALLAGDALSLLGPAGLLPGPDGPAASWWLATAQAGVVGLGVVALLISREARDSA